LAYFKDGFRNPVSHSSVLYERPEAKVVYDQAFHLISRLATRMHE